MISERLKNENDQYRRRLLLIGYLTEKLRPQGVVPIVVGGHAVEIYTFQDYSTQDIDLVVTHRELLGGLLESCEFQRCPGARHWINEELDLAIEIPDNQLAGDMNRLLEVEVDEFSVFVIGVEDLIVDRLNAYVHWCSISDYEQALKVYLIHYDQINQEYLLQQVAKNGVVSGLERLNDDWRRITKK